MQATLHENAAPLRSGSTLMKKSLVIIGIVASVLVSAGAVTVGQTAPRSVEQRHFSAEDEGVKHPTAIPDEVLAILAKDDMVRDQLEHESIAMVLPPQSWFSASQIHLHETGENDLIVVAEGPLVGANVDTFWVFIHTSQGFKLALTIPAHDLAVLSRRSHGYRNIAASAENCCTITNAYFRFNGKEYERYSSKTEDIK